MKCCLTTIDVINAKKNIESYHKDSNTKMSFKKRIEKGMRIIKLYRNKYYSVDFWRITFSLEFRNKYMNMTNKQTRRLLNIFVKKGLMEKDKESKKFYRVKNGTTKK